MSLFPEYDFTYLGFEIAIYPSVNPNQLTILIHDSLKGTQTFSCFSKEITEDVMQFAMERVHEQIANDEEM